MLCALRYRATSAISSVHGCTLNKVYDTSTRDSDIRMSKIQLPVLESVQEGQLRGIERKSLFTEKYFCSFLGIPYAEPPIGELRFRAPVPVAKWDGVLDASKERDMCVQMDFSEDGTSAPIGSEDCLYLNVHTPKAPSKISNKRAVMVFVHGGGFCLESSRLYPPNFLIDYDVILVTLNYRLHIFGFLNTGTPSCPGNAGLKDQLLALKWVKKNIASFGGDPENITLMGQSAGATSVHLHMLSPLSKGLFNRAILQSGNALSPWAFEKDPESRAREVSRLSGHVGEDLEDLVRHLKEKSAKELCELAFKCALDFHERAPGRCTKMTFIPSVEKIQSGAFLPDTPKNLMAAAVPVKTLIGFNDQEGLSTLNFLIAQQSQSTNLLPDVISMAVGDNACLRECEQAELLAKIDKFYLGNESTTSENVAEVLDFCSDLYFMKFYEAIDHLVESNVPPYLYLFAHHGNLNRVKIDRSAPYISDLAKGATHGDELGYLFHAVGNNEPINETDKAVINQFCILWTNFAKTGSTTFSLPHVEWRAHTSAHPCYLRIQEKLNVLNEHLLEKRVDFWKQWSSKFI